MATMTKIFEGPLPRLENERDVQRTMYRYGYALARSVLAGLESAKGNLQ